MPRKKKYIVKFIGGPSDGAEYKTKMLSRFIHIPVIHKAFTPDEYYTSRVYEFGYTKDGVHYYYFFCNQNKPSKKGKENDS